MVVIIWVSIQVCCDILENILPPSSGQVNVAVKWMVFHIHEVLDSDLSQYIIYRAIGVWCSPKSLQAKSGIIAQIGACLLRVTTFPIRYSVTINVQCCIV
jgi:hypothetical protein